MEMPAKDDEPAAAAAAAAEPDALETAVKSGAAAAAEETRVNGLKAKDRKEKELVELKERCAGRARNGRLDMVG